MFQCPNTQLDRSRDALTGIITPNLTPFTSETGAVDEAWIPQHLGFLEANHVDGILVLGTTGEGPSLSMEERQRMIDLVLAHCGSMFVMAGTGCASLVETITLSRYAVEHGVDAVLVMPPFYFKSVTEAGVLRYYQTLCDALPAHSRVLLYHIPQVTAVPITPAIIEGLLQSHPSHFYGIKDSSGDEQHVANLVQRYQELHIYNGSDTCMAHALAAGVSGVISALSNVWPDRVSEVLDEHMNSGDVAAAQERLVAARRLVTGPHMPPALKAALPLVSNLPRTSVRTPLVNLSDDEVEQMQAALSAQS